MPTTRDDTENADETSDGAAPVRADRCAGIRLENGGILIYDTRNRSAWIQSSLAVSPKV